jgi:hypothetical protein
MLLAIDIERIHLWLIIEKLNTATIQPRLLQGEFPMTGRFNPAPPSAPAAVEPTNYLGSFLLGGVPTKYQARQRALMTH